MVEDPVEEPTQEPVVEDPVESPLGEPEYECPPDGKFARYVWEFYKLEYPNQEDFDNEFPTRGAWITNFCHPLTHDHLLSIQHALKSSPSKNR